MLTNNDFVRLGVSWTGDGTYGSGIRGGTWLLGLLAFGFCGGGCGDMLFAWLIQSSSSYIKTGLLGIYMWIYVYLFVITIYTSSVKFGKRWGVRGDFQSLRSWGWLFFFSSFDATPELQPLPHMAPNSTKEVRIKNKKIASTTQKTIFSWTRVW